MDTPSSRPRRAGFNRRKLLGGAAAAGGGLALAGVGVHAAADTPKRPTPPLRALTKAEAAIVGAMADRIFPPDEDSPGAVDLGVVTYLDGQLAGDWGKGARFYDKGPFPEPTDYGHGYQLKLTPAELYKAVLPKLDAEATKRYGKGVAAADDKQVDELLTDLQAGKVDLGLADSEFGYTSASFFTDFLQNVKEGLFADPMYHGNKDVGGWKWIDYPGDPMAYGDIYYATFGRADDSYSVQPKGMEDMG